MSIVVGKKTFLLLFINSVIYYMGHGGRPWQVHSTYLNKRKVKKSTERKRERERQIWKKRQV